MESFYHIQIFRAMLSKCNFSGQFYTSLASLGKVSLLNQAMLTKIQVKEAYFA